jgi:mono/diheme cytochrome c family protein
MSRLKQIWEWFDERLQLGGVIRESMQHPVPSQVIQGGGNMPAYGKNPNPAEVTALVSFLETLHPAGRPPARDASQTAMQQTEPTPASSR